MSLNPIREFASTVHAIRSAVSTSETLRARAARRRKRMSSQTGL